MGPFESLRYRDFRLLWSGAILSNIGSWMQTVALAWYVLVLTGSPFWVSFVTFVNFLPTVLSPVWGALTDRMDRRRILLWAQGFMMADASLLALLVSIDRAGLAVVMSLTLGLGLGLAINWPAWTAFLPTLVPSSALVNAVALNSVQFNLARVIGPAIAGVLVATVGPGLVFALNAGSFVTVLVALSMIRPPAERPISERSIGQLVMGGFRYTLSNRVVRTMVAAVAAVGLFAAPLSALLPVFAADVFGRGAEGYGTLAAAMGAGSVGGALLLGRVGNRITPGLIGTSMVALGVALGLIAATRSYAAGVVLVVGFGAAFLFSLAGTNSSVMLRTEEPMRGRVVSIWMLAFGVSFPVGSLVAGAAAQTWGAPRTAGAGATACAAWGLGLLWWWRRRR